MTAAVVDVTPADDLGEVFPISLPPIQFNSEQPNAFNALCGLTIYRGNALGGTYEGNLFVAESLTNLVTRRKLRPVGPTFVAERTEAGKEFLAAEDPWFHPVFLTTGPDGALYVVDFYRELVEHPRYVASQEIRERVDWRNGFSHGRIWRVRRKQDEGTSVRPRLSDAPTSQLVDHLNHPVGWWRDTSQRLLVERQNQSAIEPLKKLLHTAESAVARLHVLWTLEGLGALDEHVIFNSLADEDAGVREHALRLCEPFVNQSPQLLQRMISLEADPAERVLFQLALSASAISDVKVRIALLSRQIVESTGNPWITRAALYSAGSDVHRLLLLATANDSTWLDNPAEWQLKFLLRATEAIGKKGFAKNSVAVLNAYLGSGDQSAMIASTGRLAIVCGLARAAAKRGKSLANLWNAQYKSTFDDVITACEVVAVDSDVGITLRQAAIEMLRHGSADHVSDTLFALLDKPNPAEVQEAAMESAVALGNVELAAKLFLNWSQRPASMRRLALKASLGSKTGVIALLDAIQRDEVSVYELPIEVERQLKRNSDPKLSGRVAELLKSKVESDRGEVIAEYSEALKLSSNALHGAAMFSKHCLACHSIQRFGAQIGPDLTGFSARPSELIMADILDPNRQVSADYLAYLCLTLDGKAIVGLIVAETPDSVTLRTADDKQFTIPTTEIDELVASGTSLMPEGFEKRLSQQDMADLLAFLRQPQRRLLERVE